MGNRIKIYACCILVAAIAISAYTWQQFNIAPHELTFTDIINTECELHIENAKVTFNQPRSALAAPLDTVEGNIEFDVSNRGGSPIHSLTLTFWGLNLRMFTANVGDLNVNETKHLSLIGKFPAYNGSTHSGENTETWEIDIESSDLQARETNGTSYGAGIVEYIHFEPDLGTCTNVTVCFLPNGEYYDSHTNSFRYGNGTVFWSGK